MFGKILSKKKKKKTKRIISSLFVQKKNKQNERFIHQKMSVANTAAEISVEI